MVFRNGKRIGRGIRRGFGKIGAKIEEKSQIRAEKKRIEREAYIKGEKEAIREKAKRRARRKILGPPRYRRVRVRRRRRTRLVAVRRAPPRRTVLFDLPTGMPGGEFTLFPHPPKRRKRR